MNNRWVDLTQLIHESCPVWDQQCGFKFHTHYSDTGQGTEFYVQSMETPLGIGTHLDAPSHCFKQGKDVSALSLEELIIPANVIDVREKVHPDYFVSEEDVTYFEKQHGKIQPNTICFIFTGWSNRWDDPKNYSNEDDAGNKHFPGISIEAAKILLARNVVGIGIDTLSPDGASVSFPVHRLILGAGKYILENLTNLHMLNPTNNQAIIMPMKIQGATEAPCRVIAKVTE